MSDSKKIFIGKSYDIKKNTIDIEYNMRQQKSFLNMIYLKQEFTEKKELERNIKRKHNSYKQQDIKKKKYDDNKFIKYNCLLELLIISKLKCYYCNCDMKLLYSKSKDPNQWTLERINNNKGHNKYNIVCSCLKCNLERRTKNSRKFLFTKKMNLIKKL